MAALDLGVSLSILDLLACDKLMFSMIKPCGRNLYETRFKPGFLGLFNFMRQPQLHRINLLTL